MTKPKQQDVRKALDDATKEFALNEQKAKAANYLCGLLGSEIQVIASGLVIPNKAIPNFLSFWHDLKSAVEKMNLTGEA